jgi:prophage antirepressor-like protein
LKCEIPEEVALAAPLVSCLWFNHQRIRVVFMDRCWWLYAADVAACLEYPKCPDERVHVDQLFLDMPREGRCRVRMSDEPEGDYVCLITSAALIQRLRSRPSPAGRRLLDWLTNFARLDD